MLNHYFHSSIGNSGIGRRCSNETERKEEKDNNPVQSLDHSRNIITLTI